MVDDLCLLMYRASSAPISVILLLFFQSSCSNNKLSNSLVPYCRTPKSFFRQLLWCVGSKHFFEKLVHKSRPF
jgi:hypothetical protein